MTTKHGLWLRLRGLFNRRVEAELEDEFRFHVEMATKEYVASGLTTEQARLRAMQDFGNRTALKEAGREAFTFAGVETFLRDIRYGLRVLVKNPGFSSATIVILALGIGANVAIFSLVYGVLLRPLPYQSGERLVVLHQQASRVDAPDVPFSVKDILDYREQNRTMDEVVEHHSMNFLLFNGDSAERVNTAVVSANFFDVLGVKPLLGRTFVASDEAHGADAVLVLSYEYWKARHGGDAAVVGKIFQMNNRPHTVIGVLPPIPQYPVENDVYMPTSQCPTRSSEAFIASRTSRMMTAFGRLKPGVVVQQAQADLTIVAHHLESTYPEAYPRNLGYRMAVAPLRQDLTRRAQTTFLVLLGAAGLVLLIACANVANLLLARLLRLEKELALRAALGASKIRLIRQLLTESTLLSTAGGLLGVALAPLALRLLVKFAERFTTRASEVRIDAPVLFFALLVSVLTGLLFGLWPAFSSSRKVAGALQGAGRNTEGQRSHRLRAGLVMAQIAISFILITGAGLVIRSFVKLQHVSPGFNPTKLITLRISPSFSHYTQTEQLLALTENVLRHIRDLPGADSVALATNFPFNPTRVASGPASVGFRIEGRPTSGTDLALLVDRTLVTPDYFQTIRQPLLAGRFLSEHDDARALPVAIVNQTMARHRWPADDPVGKRVSFGSSSLWVQIVGVVGDTKEYGLNRAIGDVVYLPAAQLGAFPSNLVVRTSADPTSLSAALRSAIRQVDPQLAVDRIATMESLEEDSMASPRVTAILMGLFAILALVISASGIAAVMALTVSQRTNEFGIRMALGGSREAILCMILRQGLTLAVAGTAVGLAGALALTRLVSALLYDTSPTDVPTLIGACLLFVLVAGTACMVPARRITGIDPSSALRRE